MSLLTTRQFADRVGVVPATVRRWVKDTTHPLEPAGRLHGGHLRFRPDQVDELLALQQPPPAEGLTPRALLIANQVQAATDRVRRMRRVI